METTTCYHRVFVYDSNGSDLFVGTSERPMKTIQAIVSLTRILRTNHGNDKILCITIRGVTYYLGTNTTTTSSRIGAITLTTNDSGTIMKAQIPSYINLEQFNELYINGRRAIAAKYPCGDLSIQGLYAKDPGFSYNVSRWLPPTINKSPCK
ncbi:unnamed protein product [Rotaria socialis]|uniref:Uncharacterized protein n=1 Tax=Rotaria socialis TaxID=392032 RepID=A0A820DJZ2_9BILA|nr:unnamed protein product [Rotaria socialis]CAF4436407.1 unnamed protein product [Rotaria socialis]CAF4778409.1 unnamed protein product [Rotaria socialis]